MGKLYPYVGNAVRLATSQEVTASFVDVGGEIKAAKSANKLHLCVNQDFTDSEDVTFRVLLLHTSGGDEFSQVVQSFTGGAGTVTLETGRVLATDADQKYVLTFKIPVGFIAQVQVKGSSIDGTDDEVTVDYILAYENNDN